MGVRKDTAGQGISILGKVVRDSLLEETTYEQRSEWWKDPGKAERTANLGSYSVISDPCLARGY